MSTIRFAATALLLMAFAAAPAAAQEAGAIDQEYADVIRFLDDDGKEQKIEKVKVASASYEQVQYTPRGGRTPVAKEGSRILEVRYGDAPKVYYDGQQNLKREQWAAAVSDFDGAKNAVEAGRSRPWLLEYAAVFKGEALLGLGRTEAARLSEAVSAFEEALKANPKSVLFSQIQLGLAQAYMQQSKWDQAREAADALLKAGEAIKQPLWQVGAAKTLAAVLLAQGKNTEAVTAFENTAALAQREFRFAKGERWQQELKKAEVEAVVEQGWARVAWAESSNQKQDWDRARDYFAGIGPKYSGSDHVSAAVLNGLGRCMMDSDPRGALLKFIEAEVKYFTARTEVARALWLKAQVYRKLPADNPRNKLMADEAIRDLKTYYPDSPWAKK